MEQSVAALLVRGSGIFTFHRRGVIQLENIFSVSLYCVADDSFRRKLIDHVFVLSHGITSTRSSYNSGNFKISILKSAEHRSADAAQAAVACIT